MVIELPTEKASEHLAARLAAVITAPLVVTFSGDIGAGKTTFIRAMLRQLGVTGAIKSPTFTLVESYRANDLQIHHFDLYRIQYESELEDIGFREYLADDAICCIEWPERAMPHFAKADIQITLCPKGAGRQMQMAASGSVGEAILSFLAGDS